MYSAIINECHSFGDAICSNGLNLTNQRNAIVAIIWGRHLRFLLLTIITSYRILLYKTAGNSREPPCCYCTLFRNRGTNASGRWRVWSGPDLNGLKVPLEPKPRRSVDVHGEDSSRKRAVLLLLGCFVTIPYLAR